MVAVLSASCTLCPSEVGSIPLIFEATSRSRLDSHNHMAFRWREDVTREVAFENWILGMSLFSSTKCFWLFPVFCFLCCLCVSFFASVGAGYGLSPPYCARHKICFKKEEKKNYFYFLRLLFYFIFILFFFIFYIYFFIIIILFIYLFFSFLCPCPA